MTILAKDQVRSFQHLFIAGRWATPASGRRIEIISPITERRIGSVPAASEADVDAAVKAARACFDSGAWPGLSPGERADAMLRVANEIEARLPELIDAFVAEVGAPLSVSRRMNKTAVNFWRWNASWLRGYPFEEKRQWDDGSGLLVREPSGVAAAIIPWNGPAASIGIKAAPALAAGCTVIAKPSWEGAATTFLLAEAFEAAGLPDGAISILPGDRSVGEYLVAHPGVDRVSFTGSTAAGRRVMEVCSRRLTRVTLELGGKSAAIICDDARTEDVIPSLIPSSVGNNGQRCASLTRLLIARSRYKETVEAVGAALAALRVGDPFDPETDEGPLVSQGQRDRVERYIRLGREAGARIVTGGGRPSSLDKGWYVQPTLFADADNSMAVAREEIFGPVVVAIPFEHDEDPVAIANDSEFGLSGAVYSADPDRALRIARRIRSGQVYVNSAGVCPVQPFGGFKQSGFGREGGKDGIGEYLETKLLAGVPANSNAHTG